MRRLFSPIALLSLACCANGTVYPSLAPRPIEKLSLSEPAAPPPAAPRANPALAARYAEIVATAKKGDADFQQEAGLAHAAAAKGGHAAIGSDAWIAAQQAATRLEAARTPVTKARADLDAERTSGEFDAAALDAAVAEVNAIDTHEREQLDGVTKLLGPG